MNLRYTIILTAFFIILAFSCGFALPYNNVLFGVPFAHADDFGGFGGFGDFGGDIGGGAGVIGGDIGGSAGGAIGDIGGGMGDIIGDIGGSIGGIIGDIGGSIGGIIGDIGGGAGDIIGDIGGSIGGIIGDIGGGAGDVGGDIGGGAGDIGGDVGGGAGDIGGDVGGGAGDVGGDVGGGAGDIGGDVGGGAGDIGGDIGGGAGDIPSDTGGGVIPPVISPPVIPEVLPPVPATIKVLKVVINDDGGIKVIADFPLLVNTTTVTSGVINTFAPGTYTVSETNQPGYAASFSGDCDSTGIITISAGQNKVCTITNNDIAVPPSPATIRVNKVVINDDGGTKVIADFPLLVNTTAVVSGVVNTFAPGTYTVSETNQPGYAATFSGDCDATGHVSIAAGQNKVCTLTNNDIAVPPVPATIKVIKVVVNDDGGTKVIADFPLLVNTTTVVSGVVNTFAPGTYTVSETNQPGYAASFSGDCDSTGILTISAGQNKVCTITNNDVAVVIPPTPPGGGGGSHNYSPNVTLSAIPHVGTQPLAYLYLSQIPYTGLDLGPIGTVLYWLALIGFTLALTYLVFFTVAPFVNRRVRNFGARVVATLNTMPELVPVVSVASAPARESQTLENDTMTPEAPSGYSSYDGFKSFAHKDVLSIEDIVKALSRERPITVAERKASPTRAESKPNVEPIYENVEPIYENVDPIAANTVAKEDEVPASVRGFTAALLEGDRTAVFAGLRQQVRGGGSPERLISDTVFLIDDAYRARIDGTACDANIARMTARFSTPILEKLVASLTAAIDSSYSSGVTGAKLALARSLAILGA